MEASDLETIAGVKSGDRKIEESFYKSQEAIIKGLLFKMDSNGRIDRDDLYQEVMAVLFVQIMDGKLDSLNAKLSTYVYSVGKNMILNKLRSFKETLLPSLLVEGDEELTYDIDQVEKAAFALVNKLQPPCDEILIDWYINKLDYEQIAIKHKYKNANMAKKKKSECLEKARKEATLLRKLYFE